MKKIKLILILALLLRFLVMFAAYHGDINNNTSWAKNAADFGLNGFYERKEWKYSLPNQPPGTIYFFWVAGKIYRNVWQASWWLNTHFRFFPSPFIWWWEQKGLWGLVKIPSILADLGIGWLIYDFVGKKKRNWALPLMSLYLFNPVSWYNSAFWGQTDSLVNFVGLIGVIGLIGRQTIRAGFSLCFSLFIKVSLLPFLPVFAAVAFWQKKFKEFLLGALGTLGALGILSLPFHPRIDVFSWLGRLYQQQILPGETGTLTVNAFNFWAILLGKKLALDNILFLGLQTRIWGILIFLFVLLILLRALRRNFSSERVIFSLALVAFASFLFLTRMHERYLFPVFPLLTLLLAFYPRVFWLYLPLSFTHLLNLYSEWWQPDIWWLKNFLIQDISVRAISLLNLLLFFVFLVVFMFNARWLKKKSWFLA